MSISGILREFGPVEVAPFAMDIDDGNVLGNSSAMFAGDKPNILQQRIIMARVDHSGSGGGR